MKFNPGDLVIVRSNAQIDATNWCQVGEIAYQDENEENGYVVIIRNFTPSLVYRDEHELVPIPKGISENKLKAIKTLTQDRL